MMGMAAPFSSCSCWHRLQRGRMYSLGLLLRNFASAATHMPDYAASDLPLNGLQQKDR